MKATYNEILNSMKTTFFNECGENVDLLGDLGARFKAVASELFSISCYGDYILKQAFPQSATGEYLDFHARLRGISRKTPARARGELTFSLTSPLEVDVNISEGTLCAVKASPYIQFSTNDAVCIPAGELTATVSATAIACGEEYNVPSGAVTVMVNPPISVSAVVNNTDFKGGYSGESDLQLRKRLLNSFSSAPRGLSAEMLRSAVLENDEILDCNVINYEGNARVYIRTRGTDITEQVLNRVQASLAILRFFSMQAELIPATAKPFDLHIEVSASENVDVGIESAMRDYVKSVRIGESINLMRLASIVLSFDGVEHCEISSGDADGVIITCAPGEYLSLADIEVNYIE